MLEAHRFDKRSTIGGSVILISSLKISLLSLTHKFSLSILKGFSLHFTLSFLASTTTTTTTFSILFFRRISLARNVRQSLISLSTSFLFLYIALLYFYLNQILSLSITISLSIHYISFCISIIITISLSVSQLSLPYLFLSLVHSVSLCLS